MVQGRTYSHNHKVKKRMIQSKDKWLIVTNTHEAIIRKDEYELAQELLSRDIKPPRQRKEKPAPSILSGYVYCNECGKKMLRGSANYKGKMVNRFVCSTYKKMGNKVCSSHYVKEKNLIDILYKTISIHTRLINNKEIIKKVKEAQRKDNVSSFMISKLKKTERGLAELKMLRQGLYKDFKLDIISSVEYSEMKIGFERQYNDFLKEINNVTQRLELEKNKKIPENKVFEYFKEFKTIRELNRNLIVNLVDRIIVDEMHNIRIIYTCKDIFKDVASLQLE